MPEQGFHLPAKQGLRRRFMSPQKTRDFEFKLGKFGLIFFTFGISLLLLFSFIFGVIVGKHIESYPEKIAKGIPSAIKQTITQKEKEETGIKEKKEEFKLTFYDTLPKKSEEQEESQPKASETPPKIQEKPDVKGQYLIQVASFKDKGKMEKLRAKLANMGYTPRIDKITLSSSGTWFRVRIEGFSTVDEAKRISKSLEKKIRGLKCLVKKYKQ